MRKLIYEVVWDGKLTTHKQNFETIDEARIALALHHRRNAIMKIRIDNDSK